VQLLNDDFSTYHEQSNILNKIDGHENYLDLSKLHD
jgi:hypothetical protein